MFHLIALDLSQFKTPPMATLAILGISLALATFTSVIGARSIDLDENRRLMIASSRARKEMMDSTRSGNQKRIDKAQRRQQELLQQQTAMTNSRMKSSMLFTLPMLLVWPTLGNFFGNTIVANFPFNFPYIPLEFSFFQWYLLCSFSLNTVLNRLFGLSFEIDPED
jgi:uncharacterized membrane protein (DUF106 family)